MNNYTPDDYDDSHPSPSVRSSEKERRLRNAAPELLAALEFYANAEAWKDVDTGIGPCPGDAIDYGASARAAIAKATGQGIIKGAGAQPDPDAHALVSAAADATDTMTDDELESAAYWAYVSKVAP